MAPRLIVAGKLRSGEYHRAVKICEGVASANPRRFKFRALPGMVDTDYEVHVADKKRHIGISALKFKGPCMVYTDEDQLVGGCEELLRWIEKRHGAYEDPTPIVLYDSLARAEYRKWRESTGHRFASVSFSIDGDVVGSCVVELYTDVCARTCANFEALAARGDYTRTPVHRVVRGGWIQMGDTEGGSGDGGEAHSGGTFPDECFAVSHDRPGIVGMANHGRHTNGSQFYITVRPTPHFDRRFVAFGRVIEGMRVVRIVEREESLNDRPVKSVLVSGVEPTSFGVADQQQAMDEGGDDGAKPVG